MTAPVSTETRVTQQRRRVEPQLQWPPLSDHPPSATLAYSYRSFAPGKSIQFTREESGTSTKRYFSPLGIGLGDGNGDVAEVVRMKVYATRLVRERSPSMRGRKEDRGVPSFGEVEKPWSECPKAQERTLRPTKRKPLMPLRPERGRARSTLAPARTSVRGFLGSFASLPRPVVEASRSTVATFGKAALYLGPFSYLVLPRSQARRSRTPSGQ